jgi:hypothetical protein
LDVFLRGALVVLPADAGFFGGTLLAVLWASALARLDLNFSTRPAVSINFSCPVKNG